MELKSCTYATVTTLGDFGPWISKVVLDLPCTVRANDIDARTFHIYVERHERTGEILMRKERGADHAAPSVGYVDVLAAYPCDECGRKLAFGTHVALEIAEQRLTKKIEGSVMGSRLLDDQLRITQLAALPGNDGDDPTCGLVFDTCRGDICPALKGWSNATQKTAVNGIALEYGFFEPSFKAEDSACFNPFAPETTVVPQKAPLVVYLHGAGEGKGNTQGEGATRAYIGNRVTAISQAQIQRYFGGFAWVLVPQSPTFWMDNGVEQLGHSNQSIYSPVIKALIDEFVAEHADRIDTDRIVVAGLSNGGFMTLRLCADYPDFFAAGLPCCAPWYNATDEDVSALAKTPLWFTHSKGDELVIPQETVLPLTARLRAVGANVHLTYFSHVEDLTGRYREADGSPKKTFNHGVWIHQFNDLCYQDFDGGNVLIDDEPVGCWEWSARVDRQSIPSRGRGLTSENVLGHAARLHHALRAVQPGRPLRNIFRGKPSAPLRFRCC